MEKTSSQEGGTLQVLHETAERLHQENPDTRRLIIAIQKFIRSHAKSLPQQYKAKTIMESRFTPAEQAFEKGMLGCGSIVNIVAEMLRHLGFRVKLVHGETNDSVDHAWISVYEPGTGTWVEYDPANTIDIPATHMKKLEVDSWDEIQHQIYSDHETLRERRIQKGLPPRN